MNVVLDTLKGLAFLASICPIFIYFITGGNIGNQLDTMKPGIYKTIAVVLFKWYPIVVLCVLGVALCLVISYHIGSTI